MAPSESRRPLLIGLGLGVVALAAVALVITLGGSDEPAAPATAATPAPASDPAAPADPARPALADAGAPAGEGSAMLTASPYKEYVVDGRIIRDHRKGNHPAPDLPPSFHPPNSHRVASTVTRDISEQVKAAIRTCAADLPPEARGPKPKVEGQVMIAIAEGKVSVVKATMKLRDIVGASEEPVRACIEQATTAITAQAPAEPDLQGYAINLSLTVL